MVGTLLAIAGSIIAASGSIPYVIETVKGKTKPRIVTWFTWSLMLGLAAAASFTDHQVGSGMFSLLGCLATGAVVIAGIRKGDRSFAKLDGICLLMVLVGLGLWQLFDQPALAVWMAILIDFTGLVPTIKHIWQKPHEETFSTYALVFVGGLLTVLSPIAIGNWSVTALGFPIYAALSMGGCAVILYTRRQRAIEMAKGETPD